MSQPKISENPPAFPKEYFADISYEIAAAMLVARIDGDADAPAA